ncbi:MAG: hypothetical protein IT214_08320 [Chitinophagaceae bacterium]|jgi:hypothetical protein|nr:hypothetical protein [Chitinophagaceae bacterium]OQY92424.1 MAG: hypothetical protein B6D37_14115 [Sphingobacteriales bacterium UTBCD1]
MYIVRDIFNLKYGHFRPVKALMEEARKNNMLPQKNTRVLSDFTGGAYRLIMEMGFNSLADFEKDLSTDMAKPGFQDWYKKFIEHVESGEREILKVIM